MKKGENDDLILETRQLQKSFGGVKAINNVHLSVCKGEIRCLIGPNGSGKTTLFNLIMGVHEPTGGEIFFKGKDITRLKPFERVRLGLSIKFQITSIFHNLTLRQNLHIPIRIGSMDADDIESQIDRLLSLTGLSQTGNPLAGTLSHGEQQWLEIGMALGTNPDLLLLDEPTAGMTLDETYQTAEIIKRINKDEGITIIVIEHDMGFVRYINEKISILHQGTIFFEGDLFAIQSNEEVKKIYLGS